MPEPHVLIREGDHGTSVASTLTDENGDAVDIETATVRFHMIPVGGGSATVDAAASNNQVGDGLVDGTRGDVSYTWGTADTSNPGLYLGEWQVTYSGGAVQTFPNDRNLLIRVTPELG